MSYRFFHMLVANSQDSRILPKKKKKKKKTDALLMFDSIIVKRKKKKEKGDKMNEESLCIKRSFSKRKKQAKR